MAKKIVPFIPANQTAVRKYHLENFDLSPETYINIKSATVSRQVAFALNSHSEKSFAGPAEISAIGLINAIYLSIIRLYASDIQPDLALRLEKSLNEALTEEERISLKREFYSRFPEKREKFDLFEGFFVKSLIIDLSNENPALIRYKSVFDNSELMKNELYRRKLKSDTIVFKNSKKIRTILRYLIQKKIKRQYKKKSIILKM